MHNLTSWSPVAAQVCICGLGARTPLGFTSASSAAAVRGAISAIEARAGLRDQRGDPMSLAVDPAIDASVPIAERMEQMLLSAVAEAALNALLPNRGVRMRCFLALPEARPGLPETVAARLSGVLRSASGLASSVHLLPFGHASGLMAIQLAAQTIAAREIDIGIVAATDSYLSSETLTWLDRGGLLMSPENRNGFPPGEAAAACVLASTEAVRQHGLPVLGLVAAAATSFEPKSIRQQTVCIGEGLTAAIRAATSSLSLPDEAVTATYCDLNGERYRSEEFVYTLLRVQEAFVDAHDYLCPADCWGDVGSASGPLFVTLAVSAKARGFTEGTVPLMWAGSESGYRSAVVLRLGSDSGGKVPRD